MIYDFHLRYHQIEQKYIYDTYLPYNERCRKKAENDRDCFFNFQYNQQVMGENNDG